MFFFGSLTSDLIALAITLFVIFIAYFKWSLNYWERRNFPYLQGQIPFGNFTASLGGKEQFSESLKAIYKEMKSRKWKFGGIYLFSKPVFFPIELDLIRSITTKDFQHFADRDIYFNEKEPLQTHLANITGLKWKNMRAKLSPVFTSGKIKAMFHVMHECQNGLVKRVEEESKRNEPIDIKEVVACFTTNIIGSCAFGLECEALEKEDSEFRKIGRRIFNTTKFEVVKRIFAMTFPKLSSFLNIYINKQEVIDFMSGIVNETIKYRQEKNYSRNDFLDLLTNIKKNFSKEFQDHDGKPLTFDEIASNCFVFFAAGFETSSTLMTFALYELASNQEIQNKLRKEITQVLEKHGKVTYDAIQEMKYLDQVVNEALRRHPPAALTNRRCTKDYVIPGTDLVVKKGTSTWISILGLHHDEEYYPEPLKFDPERFSEANKSKIPHFSFMPFGEGPRNCIGLRFGLLQAKMGLVILIKNFKLTVNSKTIQPIKYQPNSIILTVNGGVWLNAEKI